MKYKCAIDKCFFGDPGESQSGEIRERRAAGRGLQQEGVKKKEIKEGSSRRRCGGVCEGSKPARPMEEGRLGECPSR